MDEIDNINEGGFEGELDAFLASCEREDAYRVERVLKESLAETTELVRFAGADGALLGPFVRKRIASDQGLGSAYEVLFRAQEAGARSIHLPRIIECRREGDRLTVVMEYVRGRTLEELVRAAGASPELASRVMPGVCDAVCELHEGFDPPLIHRDLKPSNIILSGTSAALDAQGTPVIIDFGIARAFRAGAQTDTAYFGTRGYAAPEQFGFGQTTVRSDVYALGMLLFFCCTGVSPTGALDEQELSAYGVPDRLARVILHATAFDPAARYTSAAELKADILAAVESAPRSKTDSGFGSDFDSDFGSDFGSGSKSSSMPGPDPGPKPVPSLKLDILRRIAEVISAGSNIVRAIRLPAVPVWLGRVWNAFLGVFAVLFAQFAVQEFTHPSPENAVYPAAYNAVLVFGTVLPLFWGVLLLMADRRRWKRSWPLIGEPRTIAILKGLLAVFLIGLAVLVAFRIALGY